MLLLFPILRRLLFTAAFLAIPLVAAEIVARKLIGNAIKHAVQTRIGVVPAIGFGSTPLLVQLIHGKLDAVTVSATGARIDGLAPLSLSATLRDVHLSNLTSLEGAIGSLRVDATLAPAGVRELLATPTCIQSLPSSLLGALTRKPRVYLFPGRVDLLPPQGRAVEVRLRPYTSGASVRFAIAGLDLAGAPGDRGQLDALRARTTCSRALSNLPFGVSLVSATAIAGALQLGFSGRGASFSAIG
jgi:LmeA-like phospholipid-binding